MTLQRSHCRDRIVPVVLAIVSAFVAARPAWAQQPTAQPTVNWEEMTAPAFLRAIEQSGGTAIIPLGIVEKHGPHLPLGTDLINVREMVSRAAAQEYAVVVPPYYVGQIFEARHQPGTLAYSERLIWDLLQETVDEVARNGIKKIILVNGHGGNNNFLPFFCQAQLAQRKDYVVYLFQPATDVEADPEIQKLLKTTRDWHGGEVETSTMLAHRPELVDLAHAGDQSGDDQARLEGLKDAYTAIWWYARFPNHYSGDARPANRELGEKVLNAHAAQLAAMIRSVKADTKTLELQQRFFGEAENPTKTPQK